MLFVFGDKVSCMTILFTVLWWRMFDSKCPTLVLLSARIGRERFQIEFVDCEVLRVAILRPILRVCPRCEGGASFG